MADTRVPSTPQNPVFEALRDVVLGNIENGIGKAISLLPSAETFPWRDDYAELFPFGTHMHDFYEWVWLLENETFINIEGSIHRLTAGDFCLLPPHVSHAEVSMIDAKPYRSLWCCYEPSNGDVYLTLCSVTSVGHLHSTVFKVMHSPPMVSALIGTLERELLKNAYPSTVGTALASTLAYLLARGSEMTLALTVDRGATIGLENSVTRFLYENYMSDLSLDDVARGVGMSRTYMCSAFKRRTGKTIGERLTELRLEQAKMLLLKGELSIGEVARAVGYESPVRFYRVFQRHEHIAPSHYGKW